MRIWVFSAGNTFLVSLTCGHIEKFYFAGHYIERVEDGGKISRPDLRKVRGHRTLNPGPDRRLGGGGTGRFLFEDAYARGVGLAYKSSECGVDLSFLISIPLVKRACGPLPSVINPAESVDQAV